MSGSTVSGDAVSGPVRPLLRVVRGNPDDAELAALAAVVSAVAAAPAPAEEPAARSRWGMPQLGRQLRPGPGAWQFSAR
ncbi:acyl-CoA carboxylase epsilon subunit [Kutzneria sp. NPDC052558]|uniref:acyl-CoA carboxylase epsilon subunit n=1 Tax=Kutzneria sp. NPDC052558 TaxID=3364121 RepID=UPI0037C5B41D